MGGQHVTTHLNQLPRSVLLPDVHPHILFLCKNALSRSEKRVHFTTRGLRGTGLEFFTLPPSMWLSHPQVFLIPLATWTPEIIRQEDGPESFGLFTSYSLEYGVLQLFDDNSYEYCGPMDFCEEIVEAATKVDIVQYRRFVSKLPPRIISLAHG